MHIYVLRGREQHGPFSLAEINTRLAAGTLSPSDLAWPDGAAQWVPLSGVAGVSTVPVQPLDPEQEAAAAKHDARWQVRRELDAAMQVNSRILERRDKTDRIVHYSAVAVAGIVVLLGSAFLLSQQPGRGAWVALCLLAAVVWTAGTIYTCTKTESLPLSFMPSYAGFWPRFAAYLVDTLILYVPHMVIAAPAVRYAQTAPAWHSAVEPINMMVLALQTAALDVSLYWLYFAISESSAWQATVGKRLLGIKVVDLRGKPISFGRASGRFFAKLLSALPLMLGYVMAAFTEDEQALHDLMAGTLVVKNEVGKPMPQE